MENSEPRSCSNSESLYRDSGSLRNLRTNSKPCDCSDFSYRRVGPSIFDDTRKEKLLSCCPQFEKVEIVFLDSNSRPWSLPDGYIAIYKWWFTEAKMWLPIPDLLPQNCTGRQIAITQLGAAAVMNIVGDSVIGCLARMEILVQFFENMTNLVNFSSSLVARSKPTINFIPSFTS